MAVSKQPVTQWLSLSTVMPWTLPRTSPAPLACAASMKAAVSFCGCTWAVVPCAAISCLGKTYQIILAAHCRHC